MRGARNKTSWTHEAKRQERKKVQCANKKQNVRSKKQNAWNKKQNVWSKKQNTQVSFLATIVTRLIAFLCWVVSEYMFFQGNSSSLRPQQSWSLSGLQCSSWEMRFLDRGLLSPVPSQTSGWPSSVWIGCYGGSVILVVFLCLVNSRH